MEELRVLLVLHQSLESVEWRHAWDIDSDGALINGLDVDQDGDGLPDGWDQMKEMTEFR